MPDSPERQYERPPIHFMDGETARTLHWVPKNFETGAIGHYSVREEDGTFSGAIAAVAHLIKTRDAAISRLNQVLETLRD